MFSVRAFSLGVRHRRDTHRVRLSLAHEVIMKATITAEAG